MPPGRWRGLAGEGTIRSMKTIGEVNASGTNGIAGPDLLAVATGYLAAGLSIIPIRADGSKAPALSSWKRYQSQPPSPAEVRRWFAGGKGVAVIGGGVSGGLEILDFETKDAFDRWWQIVAGERGLLPNRLPVIKTPGRDPSGGRHVYYRCAALSGNTKLAQADDGGKPKTLIETRGEGGYVLAPGCPAACHPTGRLYEHLAGPPLTEIPEITPAERELLWDAARSLNDWFEPATPWDAEAADGRPGDDYNARASWAEILEAVGCVKVREASGLAFWRRPGKTHGWSATTGVRAGSGKDLLHVFSTNFPPFQAEKSYTKFAARALLSHAGDFKVAAKELARQGYGLQRHAADQRADGRPPPESPTEGARAEPVLLTMSKVEAKPVEWLWLLRIPRGGLTVLDGDPDLGKSTIALDLTARVSCGWQMPPAAGPVEGAEPEGVLLLNAEDDPECTIKPRLAAAGADLSRVHLLEAVRIAGEEQPPVLPWDLDLVERLILDKEVGLVVVDPFMAYLDGKINAHKDQDVRRCLHRLKRLAQRTRAAVIIIRHLNKLNGPPALYRGGGSIGIIGAARSALVVGRDPDNPDRRVLASNKCNLAQAPRSLTYTLESRGQVAVVAWGEETDLTANDILSHAAPRARQSVGDQCAEAIRVILAGGMQMESGELDAQLREMDYTDSAIRSGRRRAPVVVSKVGFQGKSVVSLGGPRRAPAQPGG
jgi:hypothetical protein